MNTPLNSSEQTKLLIFAIFFIPTIFFFVGIIPFILITFGIYMMGKNKEFSYVQVTGGYLLAYIGLISCIPVLMIFYGFIDGHGDVVLVGFLLSIVAFFYFMLTSKFYLEPLKNHKEWVEKNGIFSGVIKQSELVSDLSETSNSVVEKKDSNVDQGSADALIDEIIKLKELLDQGVITDEEFSDAKKSILKN